MKPFEVSLLLWPGIAIGLLTFVVTLRVTHNALTALNVAAVKAVLFVLYFSVRFDGTFTFLDDWSYIEGGRELAEHGFGLLSTPQQWGLLLAIGGGDHFAYYIYNAYAFKLFGTHYFAPVACNVLLTLAVAALGTRLARTELRLSWRQARWFYVFLVLHPDILAWSTVVNSKDIATLLLHVVLLQAGALYLRGQQRQALLIAAPATAVLAFMRFYVPFLFLAALVLASMISRGERGHLRRVALAAALLAVTVALLGERIDYALQILQDTLVNPFYGFARVVLTPIPFGTEVEYTFLDIPALIHWLLVPFAIGGALRLARMRTPFTRFFIVYLLVFLCLYALVGELQGPRHRVQLDYAIAVLQFVGLLRAARMLRPRVSPLSPHAATPAPTTP